MVTASRVFYDQRSSSLLPSPSHRSVVVSCGRYSHVLWLFPSSLQKVQSYGNLPDCGSFCASTEAIIVPHGRLSVLLSICLHIIELWSERNFWNELILLQTGTSGMKRHLCGSGGQRSHWDETSPLSFVGQEVKGQGHTGMKCHFCGSGGQRSHWDETSPLWVRRSKVKVTLGWNVIFVGQEVKGHTGMKRQLCGSGSQRSHWDETSPLWVRRSQEGGVRFGGVAETHSVSRVISLFQWDCQWIKRCLQFYVVQARCCCWSNVFLCLFVIKVTWNVYSCRHDTFTIDCQCLSIEFWTKLVQKLAYRAR